MHPQATRTSCRSATPLKGATPAARRSRFRGVPGIGELVLLLSLALTGVAAQAADPAAPASSRVPQPVIEAARGGQCVEDPAFMRRNHMELLKHQRDDTMRGGIRGAKYSLKTCIECHASQTTNSVTAAPTNFCVSCHCYAAVKNDCFECHATQPPKTSSVPPQQAVAQQQVKP
jgi:hypothetical protein